MPAITVDARGKPPPRAKALPITLQLGSEDTVADIKRNIQLHFPRMAYDRQRLTLDSKKALDDATTVASLGNATVYLKDLGPQISWRVVFFIEYLGPLLIHPLFYHYPKIYSYFTSKTYVHSNMQSLVYTLVIIHYLKRELESIFVHRFSHSTMPAFNILKNSAHYWLLSGALLAGSIYGPWYSSASLEGTLRDDPRWLYTLTVVWIFAELSNLKTHLTLRNLRPAGSRERGIPYGYGFDWVTFPNYMFEILAWTAILLMSLDWACLVFLVVGTVQMTMWAIKKHKNYKKEFGSRYPRRYIMIPFIL